MEKKDYIEQLIVDRGRIYLSHQLPSYIGQAIYDYGSNEDYHIILFIDFSEQGDGHIGMIWTDNAIYFQFAKKGIIRYDDIQRLVEKKSQDGHLARVECLNQTYTFSNRYLNIKSFLDVLSQLCDLDVVLDMNKYDKINTYITMILDDLLAGEYEDLLIDDTFVQQIQDYRQELHQIMSLDQQYRLIELEMYNDRMLRYFDELGLDSDEIDELLIIQKECHQSQNQYMEQVDQMLNQAGISPESLKDKSPEQLNAYIDNLCEQFHISRDQVEEMAKKFQFKG